MNINITLIGQMITFLLFVWFTKAYVWPPVIAALKARQEKIADGLAAAEKGHVELAKAKEDAVAYLKASKDEGANIVVEAKKQADAIVDQARQQAHDEGARIIQQAHAEITNMQDQAKEALRSHVADIAVIGAEKILGKSIDVSTHETLLDELVEEM